MERTKTIILNANDDHDTHALFDFDTTDVVYVEDWCDGECNRGDECTRAEAAEMMRDCILRGWTVFVSKG